MAQEYGENDLLNAVIEMRTNDVFGDTSVRTEPEAHYNYYGSRGVADLLIEETYGQNHTDYTVCEFKSAAALDHVTGANEIIRQFNRMRQYFFKDDDRDCGAYHDFVLSFTPAPDTLAHLSKNAAAYRQVLNANVGVAGWKQDSPGTMVSMRFPDPTGCPPLVVNDDKHVPYSFDEPDSVRQYLQTMSDDWADKYLNVLFSED